MNVSGYHYGPGVDFLPSVVSFLGPFCRIIRNVFDYFPWCSVTSLFDTQLVVLVPTRLPCLTHTIFLLSKSTGPLEGKGDHNPLRNLASKSGSISSATFVMLHAWNILNGSSDLFNNSGKCHKKMQTSSFSPCSPGRSHLSWSTARA